MTSGVALPTALAFLNNLQGDRREQYRSAYWLSCAFHENVWTSYTRWTIDFRVRLSDGRYLTDECHSQLLDVLKIWICIQSHFDCTGGIRLNERTLRERIRFTLHAIDYILLNSDRFDLPIHGLSNITENDLLGLLYELSQSSSVANSIYRWPSRLSAFLRAKISTLTNEAISNLLASHPEFGKDIPPPDERLLDLCDSEIISARCWLWLENFYYDAPGDGYRYCPSTTKLADIIYRDTLGGRHGKEIPTELLLGPAARYRREFPAVPVKSPIEGQMTEKVFVKYVASIRRLGLLSELGLPVPVSALRAVDCESLVRSLSFKQLKRYRNLPQKLVFDSLRQAIEFGLTYGTEIITSVLRVLEASSSSDLDCRSFCVANDIRPLLTQRVASLGVTHWTVQDASGHADCVDGSSLSSPHFKLIRANVGLWELLRVLYGCVQVCVGTLTARRQGELTDLDANMCLDTSSTYLVFSNRKSGQGGMRKREARPIPAVAVRLIRELERLQTGLIALGLQNEYGPLFAFPNFNSGTLVGLAVSQYNENLDYFCDYFETPINEIGERYYIRQHQLRRFIAMLFFWGRAFGGLDTLRWFLGHNNVKHLYHYITESVPGDVLRSIQAIYAVDQLKSHAEDTEGLADLIAQRFGTRNVSVLDSDELTEYVEELVIAGTVEIEPEFLSSPDGTCYRILVVIHPKRIR